MIGADVIVVWVSNGQPNAVDYLLTARQQVSIRLNYSLNAMYQILVVILIANSSQFLDFCEFSEISFSQILNIKNLTLGLLVGKGCCG